jgi:hypothetical protein
MRIPSSSRSRWCVPMGYRFAAPSDDLTALLN